MNRDDFSPERLARIRRVLERMSDKDLAALAAASNAGNFWYRPTNKAVQGSGKERKRLAHWSADSADAAQ